mgnify:CR=1 FL=1
MRRVLASTVAGFVVALLVLEVVLRLLPVSTATMTGYHVDPDILTYPARHRWTVSTGWDLRNPQQLRGNNLGFASDVDFVPDTGAVALIGDSYVEASMLDARHRPAAQLQARLEPRRAVYGMGTPGTALLDYAQRVRFAREQLSVRDFVVWLEGGDARQALCGSGNVVSRCLDPRTLLPTIQRRPPPSAVQRWLRHSALAQYVYSQLKVDWRRLAVAAITRTTPEAAASPASPRAAPSSDRAIERARAVADAAVDQFFRDVAPHLGGQLLFVVDGQRGGPPARPTLADAERRFMIERLRWHGAEVLDMEPVYAAHVARSGWSLEVGPYDRHLNARGVALVMDSVAARLRP